MNKIVFSIVETPTHPKLSHIYLKHGLQEIKFNTTRTAMVNLRKQTPDILVAEFIYAYSNNYSGIHISNLDVLLISLKKYAPNTKVIIITTKHEQQFLNKLPTIMPIYKVLIQPVTADQIDQTISKIIN